MRCRLLAALLCTLVHANIIPLVLRLPKKSLSRLMLMSKWEGLTHRDFVSKWVQDIWTAGFQPGNPGQSPASKTLHSLPSIARPSYFDGTIDDEPARRYTLNVDTKQLQQIAGSEKRLIVSWTTGGPKRWSIAHNLALSIRKNTPQLERFFVFIALDSDAVVRAEASNFNVVLNEGSQDLQDDIWKMRWLIQTTCIALDLEVLVVDSDIVFLGDPFAHFFFDSDLEAMTDHFFPAEQLWATWLRPAEHINTGFIYARPSNRLLVPQQNFSISLTQNSLRVLHTRV